MKDEITLTIGRYAVIAEYTPVPLSDGSPGIESTELCRVEREAAIAVFSRASTIEGEELRFARKAIGLQRPELA